MARRPTDQPEGAHRGYPGKRRQDAAARAESALSTAGDAQQQNGRTRWWRHGRNLLIRDTRGITVRTMFRPTSATWWCGDNGGSRPPMAKAVVAVQPRLALSGRASAARKRPLPQTSPSWSVLAFAARADRPLPRPVPGRRRTHPGRRSGMPEQGRPARRRGACAFRAAFSHYGPSAAR